MRSVLAPFVLALIVGCAGASTAVADPRPDAKIVFKDQPPAAVAPRLAAECTRRLMALIRNTPEQVVCKYRPRFSASWPGDAAHEVWTFILTAAGRGRTMVEGHTAFEAVSEHGYAVVAFANQKGLERGPMRDFLKDVHDLGDLRGPFMLRPQAAE